MMQNKHKPSWEMAFVGVSLPWWLAWAPSLASSGWRATTGAPLPRAISDALGLSHALLLIGILLTLIALSSDVAAVPGTEKLRALATLFLLGLCTLPLTLLFT